MREDTRKEQESEREKEEVERKRREGEEWRMLKERKTQDTSWFSLTNETVNYE